ncbi:Nuclease S1 [Hordeum vulgare]|nr:Nuclease S1 [Hordeum vulgare]
MTCKIVEGLLMSEVSAEVKGLLSEWANGELAVECSWPDAVRRQMSSADSLHFADTHGNCKFSYASTCSLRSYCPT